MVAIADFDIHAASRRHGSTERTTMSADPVAELLSDPRFKGKPITWDITPESYDAIRRAWLTHVHAEEVLFKPFTEDVFKTQMQIMLGVFTDDCVMELASPRGSAGRPCAGHRVLPRFPELAGRDAMGPAGAGHRPAGRARRGEHDRQAGQGVRRPHRGRRAGPPAMGDLLPVGAGPREVQGRIDLLDPPIIEGARAMKSLPRHPVDRIVREDFARNGFRRQSWTTPRPWTAPRSTRSSARSGRSCNVCRHSPQRRTARSRNVTRSGWITSSRSAGGRPPLR